MILEKIKEFIRHFKEYVKNLQGRFFDEEQDEEFLEWDEGQNASEGADENSLEQESYLSETGENMAHILDKVILVTGGGGSIGSELCRQLARHQPRQLILFDICEKSAYEVQQELKKTMPKLALVTLIGSVRDTARVNQVFREYKPQIVYHTASYKNRFLMEQNPSEAVKNNVLGALNVAVAAKNQECEQFVLISSNEARNHIDILDSCKSLCEKIIQAMNVIVKLENTDPELSAVSQDVSEKGTVKKYTEFTAVRFDERKENGGLASVISDVVDLLLCTRMYSKAGEIVFLKLNEDMAGIEGMIPTEHDRIFICAKEEINAEEFFRGLYQLKVLACANSPRIREAVAEMVADYRFNPVSVSEAPAQSDITIEPEFPEIFPED